MKSGQNKIRSQWLTLSALATCIIGNTAMAAPGVLGTKPLILDTVPVQPNIFFLVDDSGSMDWEDLLNAGTQYPASSLVGDLDFTPSNNNNRGKRLLCRGFNVMAYDPNVTYAPWAGVDADGNAYTDLTLTTARSNPYNSTTTDISNHKYVVWTDSDGDGEYDGPGSTNVNSNSTSGDECDIGNLVSVSSLSAAQQTNYANWYSYYRKREYVAKRALSQIIKDSTARVGLGSLHNHNSIRTLVADIDDISTPVDATAQSNKTTLLDKLFNVRSSNGTPLRNGLKNVGEYFAGNSGWGDSPILSNALGGQCQKNFAIVMSDGFWNGSSPSVGNTDGDNNTDWDGASYADTVSDTLADVAMKYYETDLKPDDSTYPDVVAAVDGVDENTAQHLVTYTVAFGVNGTLTADPTDRTASFNWPTPSSGTATTIDDMRHAAWNGRGKFLSAGDPQQLIKSLNDAIQEINSLSGSSAAAALNTTSIQSGSHVYMASYNSQGWHGDLMAYAFDDNGFVSTSDPSYHGWSQSAGKTLSDMTWENRKIYTNNGSDSSLIELKTTDSLSDSQKADLLTGMPGSETETSYLQKVVNFVYGDHSNEVGEGGNDYFRKRGGHRLGDIVHSGPIHVGVPNAPYPDALEATPYSSFKFGTARDDLTTATNERNGTIFVGSNDGMLHAFNATDGSEQFAYVPNLLFSTAANSGLHYLANPAYDHNYYADLTPTVGDVFVDNKWKTMLVSGLRGGGKGIFALDVTDEGKPVFQFEYTHVDMGYTFSEIQIARMNNGKWAAVFGNGYNNTGDGTAKLFIVYLDGSTPKIIPTGVGSITNSNCADASSDCNGLSTPALADLNGDGNVDRIYAGDVQGNMWSFKVTGEETSWALAYGSSKPLFTACRSTTSPCPAADRQPVTSKPALARHPSQSGTATHPNIMVMFGTGQFITTTDSSDASTQAVYGVWDKGDSELVASDLVEQTINQGSGVLSQSGETIRTISDLSVNYVTDSSETDHGWYFDLPSSKERVVVNPVTYGNLLFFNTMIPGSPEVCSPTDGSGWLMAVDIYNGGQPNFQPMDVNNDNAFDAQDALAGNDAVFAVGTQVEGIPTESRFVSDKRITIDSDKELNIQQVQGIPNSDPSRMSWTVL